MLPILAKYRHPIASRWESYMAVGPFVSRLLTAKKITSGSSYIYLDAQETKPLTSAPQSFDKTESVKNDLHRWNTGISGHFGLDYKLGNGRLFLEGGGNYGWVALQKNKSNGKNKTGAAVAHLGYQFKW